MAAEDQRVPYEQVDIDEARHEMFIDRMESAGWTSAGGFSPHGEAHVGFYRRDGLYRLSPEETAIRLNLVDDQGGEELDTTTGEVERFGYEVEVDPRTGDVVISYSGPTDERYHGFIEDLIALGHDLNHQQAAENPGNAFKLKAAAYADVLSRSGRDMEHIPMPTFLKEELRPNRATNKLMRQVGTAEGEDGTVQMMVNAGILRDEAIASIVSLVATTFTEDIRDPNEEAAALEKWHNHVDYRYTKLVEALQAQHTAEVGLFDFLDNTTLQTLSGIREGVRRATIKARERANRLQELGQEAV